MTNQKKFTCPGCQKVLSIPEKHLGKKVKCPKCATTFRAGTKPTEVQADPFGDLVESAAPIANVVQAKGTFEPRKKQAVSRRQAIERGKKKARKKRQEGSEIDQRVQSAGIFLITLPGIATVLPLVGLQLRRLAQLGDAAPLAAAALGLIGVGCIVYARQNRGDAAVLGSAAAAWVLFSGLGGYMLLTSMTGALQEAEARRGDSPRSSSRSTSTESSKRPPNMNISRSRSEAESRSRNSTANTQMERNRATREEVNREKAKQSERSTANSNSPFFPNTSSADRSDLGDSNGTSPEPRIPTNPFGGFGNSDLDPQQELMDSIEQSRKKFSRQSDAFRRWGSGLMQFAKFRRTKKLEDGLKFTKTIGKEQRSGRLFFYLEPIRGMEVVKFGSYLYVPICDNETPSDDAIFIGENQKLAGFNLAFDGDHIVGVQGLFAPSDEEANDDDPDSGHWLGKETDNVQSVVVKNGALVHGFVCFTKGTNMTGFALVYKN